MAPIEPGNCERGILPHPRPIVISILLASLHELSISIRNRKALRSCRDCPEALSQALLSMSMARFCLIALVLTSAGVLPACNSATRLRLRRHSGRPGRFSACASLPARSRAVAPAVSQLTRCAEFPLEFLLIVLSRSLSLSLSASVSLSLSWCSCGRLCCRGGAPGRHGHRPHSL